MILNSKRYVADIEKLVIDALKQGDESAYQFLLHMHYSVYTFAVRYVYDEFWLKQLIDNMQSNVKMKYMYKSYPFYKTNISLQLSEWLGPIVILYLSPKLNNYLHFKHDLPVG